MTNWPYMQVPFNMVMISPAQATTTTKDSYAGRWEKEYAVQLCGVLWWEGVCVQVGCIISHVLYASVVQTDNDTIILLLVGMDEMVSLVLDCWWTMRLGSRQVTWFCGRSSYWRWESCFSFPVWIGRWTGWWLCWLSRQWSCLPGEWSLSGSPLHL